MLQYIYKVLDALFVISIYIHMTLLVGVMYQSSSIKVHSLTFFPAFQSYMVRWSFQNKISKKSS